MKHTTSLRIARQGAKSFLGLLVMAVLMTTLIKFEWLRFIVGSLLVYAALVLYPHVERFFEETFEIVES